MSSFTKPLILKFLDKKKELKRFELHEEFVYESEPYTGYGVGGYGGKSFVVPRGFRTDFASVPRGLWNIIPPVGLYGKATVLRDYLCETKIVSRKEADRLFLEAMEVLGVGWLKRKTMYFGVRTYSVIRRL